MNLLKKIFSLILALVMALSLAVQVFAVPEEEADETGDVMPEVTSESSEVLKSFLNSNGRVLSVAKYQGSKNYSATAPKTFEEFITLGVDIISVEVKLTEDKGFLIVSDGEEITLGNAIEAVKGKAMLLIDNGFEYANEINTIALELDACDSVILRGAKTVDDIKAFMSANSTVCYVSAKVTEDAEKASKAVSEFLENGVIMVELEASDESSKVFSSKTLGKFKGSGRAFVSMTDESLCGGRQDRTAGWEEMIGLGVSMIETDYPEELVAYLSAIEAKREATSNLLSTFVLLDLSKYTTETRKTYELARTKVSDLVTEGTVTYSEIDEAYYTFTESLAGLVEDPSGNSSALPGWAIALIVIAIIIILFALTILVLRVVNKTKRKKAKFKNFKDTFKSEVPTENDEELSTNIEEDLESNMGIEEEPEEELEEESEEPKVLEDPEAVPNFFERADGFVLPEETPKAIAEKQKKLEDEKLLEEIINTRAAEKSIDKEVTFFENDEADSNDADDVDEDTDDDDVEYISIDL